MSGRCSRVALDIPRLRYFADDSRDSKLDRERTIASSLAEPSLDVFDNHVFEPHRWNMASYRSIATDCGNKNDEVIEADADNSSGITNEGDKTMAQGRKIEGGD